MTFNQLILTCLAYVALLFFVAFAAERRAIQGQRSWTRSPLVYTLSLSVYCTAWTFYGAVGAAVRSGLEFVTIYLGPTLVMLGWWLLLRKLVRVGKTQRSTSIADLISSRYGKSNGLGVVVTMIAVVGTTPYIALQLQSVSASFDVFAGEAGTGDGVYGTSLWVAAGLTLFTILFGTRNLNSNERHHGVVIAIAVEAVVKLLALVLLGCWVIWGLGGGPEQVLEHLVAVIPEQVPVPVEVDAECAHQAEDRRRRPDGVVGTPLVGEEVTQQPRPQIHRHELLPAKLPFHHRPEVVERHAVHHEVQGGTVQ